MSIDTAALTASELAEMRATLNESLPSTGLLRKRVDAPDGGGGQTHTWSAGVEYAIRLSPVGGGEDQASGGDGKRVNDESTHIATFPYATVVDQTDRIVVEGQDYDVTLVRNRVSWPLCVRVECKEVVR